MWATSGAIDSREVNRALRESVWPALKPLGFSRRSERTAWRDHPTSIQVVNFQSFNSYLAQRLASTTFSFSVNLGVFYPAIAAMSSMAAFIKDRTRPVEQHCHARFHLGKGLPQPDGQVPRRPSDPRVTRLAGDRPDVWFVLPDGSNLEAAVVDARDQILSVGIPWLERLSDLSEARRHFREVANSYQRPGIVAEQYGGTLGSPNRLHKIGALSAALGDGAGVNWAIDQMSVEPYYGDHPADLELLRASRRQDDAS
jgi:hypothetical protein